MYKETIPTMQLPELDRTLWSELASHQPLRSEADWIRLYRRLGHTALEAVHPYDNIGAYSRPYLRGNSRLSAEDIRELESYLDFLRHHYGIPEGATVFPKREAEPPAPTDPEDDDAP